MTHDEKTERNLRLILTRLYSTTVINLLSDSIASVALPLAFLYVTGSVSLAAALVASAQIPQIILSLPLSALADRLPRRPLVITSYIVEATCLSLLALSLTFESINLAIVVILGVLRGSFSQLGISASAGYIPQLLGRQNLLRYHSRVETVEGAVAVVGPPMTGALVSAVGGLASLVAPATLSAVNALLYWNLPSVPAPDTGKSGTRRPTAALLIRDICEGLAFAVKHRVQLFIVMENIALGAMTTSYVFGVIAHLKQDVGMSAMTLGIVLACSGFGGIVGSLTFEKIFPVKRAVGVLLGALLCSSACLALFGYISHPLIAGLLLFILDAAWVACFIYGGTLAQYATPDRLLARMESVTDLAFTLGGALASGAAALWISSIGARGILLTIACVSLVPILIGVGIRGPLTSAED